MALTSDSINLLFKAKGDTDDAKKAFKELRSEVEKVDSETKKAGSGPGSGLTGVLSPDKLAGITSGFYGILGGVTAVTGAITAAAAVAVGLTKQLFDLATQASEYGSNIYDASVKTGLSAETMSALKVVADQSGTSLENVSNVISKFSRLIGEAAQGSKTAVEALSRLGIDPKKAAEDLDGALAQVIERISEMKTPVEKATAAQQLFGKSGADFLKVIDQMNGNLPGTIAELKRLGVTISDEDAVAADNFGDSMALLHAQFERVQFTLGAKLMPVFLRVATAVSEWIAKNGDTIARIADNTANIFSTFISGLQGVINFIDRNRDKLEFARTVMDPFNFGGRAMQAIQSPMPVYGAEGGGMSKQLPVDYLADQEARERQKREAEQARAKELASQKEYIRLQMDQARNYHRDEMDELEKAFIAKELTAEDYRERAFTNLRDYEERLRRFLAMNAAKDAEGKTEAERRNIELARQNAEHALSNEIARDKMAVTKVIEDQEKKRTDIEDAETQKRRKIEEQATRDAQTLARAKFDTFEGYLKLLRAQGLLTEKEFVERLGQLAVARLEWEKTQAESISDIQLLDEQLTQQKLENSAAMIKATQDETAAVQAQEEAYEQYRIRLWNAQMEAAEKWAQLASGPSVFDTWRQGLENFVTALHDAVGQSTGPIDMLTNAFMNVTRAIGQTIQQYLLYGSTGPAVMRKILASALASIAAEAAVRAIYAAALGFFFLAIGAYTDATNAFIAAAIWGTIAVGTGLAARAVAGNAFQQQTSGAYGSSSVSSGQGSGNGGTVYSSRSDQIVDVSRNAPVERGSSLRLDVGIKLDSNGVLDVIRDSVRSNGIMRQLIVDTV